MPYRVTTMGELTGAGEIIADLALEIGCGTAAKVIGLSDSSVSRAARMSYGVLSLNPAFMDGIPHTLNYHPLIPTTDERIAKHVRVALEGLKHCAEDWSPKRKAYGRQKRSSASKAVVALTQDKEGDDSEQAMPDGAVAPYSPTHVVRPWQGTAPWRKQAVTPVDRKEALASLEAPDGGGLGDVRRAIQKVEAAREQLDSLGETLQAELSNLLWLDWYFTAKSEKEDISSEVASLRSTVEVLRAENTALANHLAGRESS
jgi:hypothetical protein